MLEKLFTSTELPLVTVLFSNMHNDTAAELLSTETIATAAELLRN